MKWWAIKNWCFSIKKEKKKLIPHPHFNSTHQPSFSNVHKNPVAFLTLIKKDNQVFSDVPDSNLLRGIFCFCVTSKNFSGLKQKANLQVDHTFILNAYLS